MSTHHEVSDQVARLSQRTPEGRAWRERLADLIDEMTSRWGLTFEHVFAGKEVSCAWVAKVRRRDGSPAVLKLRMPGIMEADHEADALRFLDGDPTVFLLEYEPTESALLVEACEPGSVLREFPEEEQDVVISDALRSLWRPIPMEATFRQLSEMLEAWTQETLELEDRWTDKGLVREGLSLFRELSVPSPEDVLLATDLHAGNVLRAKRKPWLAIDLMPFVGDRAYDATQHLINCEERLRQDMRGTIERVAGLLDVDADRVRLWLFARYAAENRDDWGRYDALARLVLKAK